MLRQRLRQHRFQRDRLQKFRSSDVVKIARARSTSAMATCGLRRTATARTNLAISGRLELSEAGDEVFSCR
jgi:hypothetical protein